MPKDRDSKHRIVIVGGVAGGMSCAARARRLDEKADIVVLERGEHVSFANCGLPYHVGGDIQDAGRLLLQTPASLRAALDLDVRPRHEVTGLDAAARTVTVATPDGVDVVGYDALVLAPGARAVRPPIAGLDSPGSAPCAPSATRSRCVSRWTPARAAPSFWAPASSGWRLPRRWRCAAWTSP